jgi:hypothetical protein
MELVSVLTLELWSEIRPHMSILARARLRMVCRRLYQEDADLDEVAAARSPLFRGLWWKIKHPILCALMRAGFDRIVAEHYGNQWAPFLKSHWSPFTEIKLPFGRMGIHSLVFKSDFGDEILSVTWYGMGHGCGVHKNKEKMDSVRDMMRFLDGLFYWAQDECHQCWRKRLRREGCRFLHPREEDFRYESVDETDCDLLIRRQHAV